MLVPMLAFVLGSIVVFVPAVAVVDMGLVLVVNGMLVVVPATSSSSNSASGRHHRFTGVPARPRPPADANSLC
jgi:hypothetical protein